MPLWIVASAMPVILIVVLASGLPVAFALSLVATIMILAIWGAEALPLLATVSYASVTSFILIAVPLFLLMGENLIQSGITDKVFDGMEKWLGRVPGGLPISTLSSATVFAAICGFAPATCTILGEMALPEMLKRGYNKGLSCGCIAGGATLTILIPPSSLMVILGYLAEVSVAELFAAGLPIGIMIALMYMGYAFVRCLLQPGERPTVTQRPTWKERAGALKYSLPVGAIIFSILGTIFIGFASPTEAAALGFWATLLLVALYGQFKLSKFLTTLSMTAQYTSMLFMIVIGASLFSRAVAYAGITQWVVSWIVSTEVSPWWVLISMQLLVLVMGCFMDSASIVFLTIPFFMPVVDALQFDPLWFAVIMMINLELGTTTPPFGLNLFILKAVAPPEVSMGDIWRGTLPFVFIDLFFMALVMAFPQIALWLPNLIRQV